MNYKNKKDIPFKVALMFIMVLILFIWGYHYFTRYDKNAKNVTILFPKINNISIGSRVVLRGVQVGVVKNISLSSNGVSVTCKISLPFKLRKNTIFKISTANMMGENQIEIIPSENGDMVSYDDYVFKGKNGLSVSEMMIKLNKISDNIGEAFSNSLIKKINNTIENINKSAKSISEIINKKQMENLTEDIQNITRSIDSLINQNSPKIKEIINKSDLTVENMIEIQDSLKILLSKINSIASDARNNDNNLNNFIKNKDLYDSFLRSSAKFDSLIDDIRKNPERYINVKVF